MVVGEPLGRFTHNLLLEKMLGENGPVLIAPLGGRFDFILGDSNRDPMNGRWYALLIYLSAEPPLSTMGEARHVTKVSVEYVLYLSLVMVRKTDSNKSLISL